MKKLIIILFYFSLTFLISCKKGFDNSGQVNTITLPPYSETGANTFGFMLNNTVWTVFGKHYINNGVGGGWMTNLFEVSALYTGPNELSVVGMGRMTIVKNDSVTLDISAGFSFLPTVPFIKNYYLTDLYPNHFHIVENISDKHYKVNPAKPLTLQLNKFESIDPVWTICSGRFFGTVFNQIDPTDSIVITDGRFDSKMIYR